MCNLYLEIHHIILDLSLSVVVCILSHLFIPLQQDSCSFSCIYKSRIDTQKSYEVFPRQVCYILNTGTGTSLKIYKKARKVTRYNRRNSQNQPYPAVSESKIIPMKDLIQLVKPPKQQ